MSLLDLSGQSMPRLPTLGLNKYMNWDVRVDQRNPFRTNKNTEMLLVARERERKQFSFEKREQRSLHIYEKSIQTRTNRAGVIREIKNLKPSRSFDEGEELRAIKNNEAHREKEKDVKKINIFEQDEGDLMKHDTLARYKYQAEEDEEASLVSSKMYRSEDGQKNAIVSKEKVVL